MRIQLVKAWSTSRTERDFTLSSDLKLQGSNRLLMIN